MPIFFLNHQLWKYFNRFLSGFEDYKQYPECYYLDFFTKYIWWNTKYDLHYPYWYWASPYLTIYTVVIIQRPLWRAQPWPKTLYVYFLKRHSKLGQTIFGRFSILQMVLHQQNVCNLWEVSSLAQIWLSAREQQSSAFCQLALRAD